MFGWDRVHLFLLLHLGDLGIGRVGWDGMGWDGNSRRMRDGMGEKRRFGVWFDLVWFGFLLACLLAAELHGSGKGSLVSPGGSSYDDPLRWEDV